MSSIKNRILKLTSEDFLAAFASFEIEGANYPASLYYDIAFNGKSYPPKPIIALAYKNRYHEEINTTDFGQGIGSKEFNHIESVGFELVKKKSSLPFCIALYDIHGKSAEQNYNTLLSIEHGTFLWDDARFAKLNEGDYIFWVNRAKKEALFTKISTKSLIPNYNNGINTIHYKGFDGKAKSDDPEKYKNFVGCDIIERVKIDEFWNYDDLSTFASQNMAVNLLVPGIKVQEISKKIDKLDDLAELFIDTENVIDIIDQAISFLQEKQEYLESREPLMQDLQDFLSELNKEELDAYLELLRKCLDSLNISYGDTRLTFNYYNKGLYFTVGKRYSLVYKLNAKEAKFFLISKSPISTLNINNTFDGEPLAYFCRRNDLNLSTDELDSVLQAMQIELDRTQRSTYRRFNKSNFEKYVFNINTSSDVHLGNFSEEFVLNAKKAGLYFSSFLTKRYISSLATKPFVIFTGLSGSGKTKLAQTFAKWICKDESQYKIIPVGADWTNREPLLGYPNSLDDKNYVLPDNGALTLLIEAIENAKNKEIQDCDPYFLILDEMNLSHVERYFADFLSTMESKDEIKLYSGSIRNSSDGKIIPQSIKLPPNLFIVGTVNIDETTYMFSPKVLDRANTIEFRIDEDDLASFFNTSINENPIPIDGLGSAFTKEFMNLANNEYDVTSKDASALLSFFEELQKLGAEFGYRTANEMIRLIHHLDTLGLDATKKESALDVAVMQKMLPKLNGSRSKLSKVLPILASFCIKNKDLEKAKQLLESFKNERKLNEIQSTELKLPLSFIKIARMYTNSIENGFASYAEG
jgi:energy-coupling factor transporter ATP-binding protein EcfA2